MKKDNGFALAEVIIASGIFAICITIVLSYVTLGLTFCGKSRDMSRAMNIARLEMAKIENIPFPPTTDDSTQSDFTVDATSSDDSEFKIKTIDTGYDSTGTVTATEDDITIRKIELSVYENVDTATATVTANDKKMVTLYTYIARNGLY